MKTDIILAGVGGQGILSIAAVIGMAALENNLFLKQSEVHGMSQRGGAVQSHLRLSDKEISSDLIPMGQADMIISVEPMESLRYLPNLSAEGWLITNTTPFNNISDYPEMDVLMGEIKSLPRHIALDADKMAKEIKSAKSSNIVVLGAASLFLNIELKNLESGIQKIFGRKGEQVIKLNIDALHAGRKFAEDKQLVK
ncbi:MAG TPA: indolepyruvate oxidoreductase subunit beta [Ignavibacteriaceae bacterium]|nr:indolepyruvate oxidoreductase subunit beta [Ignavibacteriaceae bacterium]